MEDTLMELQRKINRIEEKDPNFSQNPKWQELRREQDEIYRLIAEKKFEYYSKRFDFYGDEESQKYMNMYREYLEKDDERTY